MTARRTATQNKAPGRRWACWSGFSRGDGSLHPAKNNREKMRKKTGAKAGSCIAARRCPAAARCSPNRY
ncbi:hypothetical protein ACLFKT_44320, partial [Paraburkholderia sp. BR14261]